MVFVTPMRLSLVYKKAELPQTWPRDARYVMSMGALKIFESPTATFPAFLMGFYSDRSYECSYKI